MAVVVVNVVSTVVRTCFSELFTPILPATTLYKCTATEMKKFLVLTMFIRRTDEMLDISRSSSNIKRGVSVSLSYYFFFPIYFPLATVDFNVIVSVAIVVRRDTR